MRKNHAQVLVLKKLVNKLLLNLQKSVCPRLEKEDLEGLASKITPINKTDEEMKAGLACQKITLKLTSNLMKKMEKKSVEDLANQNLCCFDDWMTHLKRYS